MHFQTDFTVTNYAYNVLRVLDRRMVRAWRSDHGWRRMTCTMKINHVILLLNCPGLEFWAFHADHGRERQALETITHKRAPSLPFGRLGSGLIDFSWEVRYGNDKSA